MTTFFGCFGGVNDTLINCGRLVSAPSPDTVSGHAAVERHVLTSSSCLGRIKQPQIISDTESLISGRP